MSEHACGQVPENGAINRALIDALADLVGRAGAAILGFAGERVVHRLKADASPVTAADEASDAILAEGLARILPGVPVVSEERPKPEPMRPHQGMFIIIDPLDGTREFVAGRTEFTVNLALIENGAPRAGIIAAPALGLLYSGLAGGGARRLRISGATIERPGIDIRARQAPAGGLTAMVSRSHFERDSEAFLSRFAVAQRIAVGSAIKFCRLAEGSADLYPRMSPTCEWDVAAGHAVLAAAGGMVVRPDGGPLVYGGGPLGDFAVPAFVACGDPMLAPPPRS